MESFYLVAGAIVSVFSFIAVIATLTLRRIVPTNEVHIVQRSSKTVSYGKDLGNGNVYYEFPSWIPVLGVNKVVLPVSVFALDLIDYEAYDVGRLPFIIDVKAFFRIVDSNIAAQRVSSFQELHNQLLAIVQGSIRSILASNEIEHILQGRATFGEQFTKEVEMQLSQWGVTNVKSIELMDIRDERDCRVIHNIMEKKKSFIEMESRTEVAKNKQMAEIAETQATRNVAVQQQEAKQVTGLREVEASRQVSIAKEEAMQAVKEQAKLTKEKEMSVIRVENVRKAEIEKEMAVTKASQQKETTILIAEGDLESKRRSSEAITIEGAAKASAEKALLLAPVEAQVTLAKEIGSNKEYQVYLVTIEQIKMAQAVGMEQAKALSEADIKIIANSDSPVTGLNKVMDLVSSRGGTQVGAMLEGLAASPVGKTLLGKLTDEKSLN